MAKVSFNKLGLKLNNNINIVKFNEQAIEVKEYLPIEEKLELIADVVNFSADQNNFANPVKVDVYTTIGIIEYYTNITFTEKQKENIPKLYDMVTGCNLYNMIINVIPEKEIEGLVEAINKTLEAVYQYKNSIMGILEMVSTDYSNLELDATNIQEKLADANNIDLLRNILSKLG